MSLKIALPKGRLAGEVLALLRSAGVCVPDISKTRKLVVEASIGGHIFFLCKPGDVPAFVEHGAADIGVAGYDTIAEEGRDLAILSDLCLGVCDMCVAGPPRSREVLSGGSHIRVATKYPKTAEKYFIGTGRVNAEVVKLGGSVELGAAVGLADVIVDIVQTGDTLKQNGLEIFETVFPVSSRLIANPAALSLKSAEIASIAEQLII